ncbi:hypothetical protein Trydic_g15627 [Trypoxylus dichotomus]
MEENLTGETYLNLLEDMIDPFITESLENQTDQDRNLLLDEKPYFFLHIMFCQHEIDLIRGFLAIESEEEAPSNGQQTSLGFIYGGISSQ